MTVIRDGPAPIPNPSLGLAIVKEVAVPEAIQWGNAGASDPEITFAILENALNRTAGKSFILAVRRESPSLETIESSIPGANPEVAIVVLKHPPIYVPG